MVSPISVQGPESAERDMHPDDLRALDENAKMQDQAKRAEMEANKPRQGTGIQSGASGGFAIVIAVGGILMLFVLLTLLSLLGIKLG